jgi:hypothetical protein
MLVGQVHWASPLLNYPKEKYAVQDFRRSSWQEVLEGI